MSSIYTKYGMDLESMFRRGSGTQVFQIFDDSGLDIGMKYLAGQSRIGTGLVVPSGEDLSAKLGSSNSGIFRTGERSVGGQSNLGGAFSAGFEFLEEFERNFKSFVEVTSVADETLGHAQAYRETRYWCYRVRMPRALWGTIAVEFKIIDGGNGVVDISEIKGDAKDKYFVVASHGGDKGHYGESRLTISVNCPGIFTANYTAKIWTNTD